MYAYWQPAAEHQAAVAPPTTAVRLSAMSRILGPPLLVLALFLLRRVGL